MLSVCVVVPCYQEATRLPAEGFLAYVGQTPDVNFCFVDDGSTDDTRAVLERMRAAHPNQIEVLILPHNLGKAGAVRAGMLHCANQPFDFLGFLDADLATPPDAIGDLAGMFSDRPDLDLVMGSRIKHLGADIRRNPARHYAGRIIATLISNLLKLPVYDTQCGAKLFRQRVVIDLFAEPFISPWLFDVELLARLIRRYGRTEILNHVAEFPLKQWIEQNDSRISAGYLFTVWYELYRIQRAYRNV